MRRQGRRTVLVLVGGFALAMTVIAAVAWAIGLRWNHTPSYPRGLWRIVSPYDPAHAKGSLVLFCPPATTLFRVGRERGYLAAGVCSGGTGALIKRVVAVPGDRVTVTPNGVSVNGRELPNSRALPVDAAGRPLPSASGGPVPPGRVWVLSEYHPRSFDSRYYGSIEVSRLQGVVTPVWIWD
jgi:conjugative transfer signal peptidase TraF